MFFRRSPPKPTAAEQLAAIDWRSLKWVFLASWTGGSQEIAPGFDIADAKWQGVTDGPSGGQRKIEGVDGVYGDLRRVAVWFIEAAGEIRVFAADEVSNGVCLVFVPQIDANGAAGGITMQPLMNNTKWEELRLAMHALKPAPRWRTMTRNGYVSAPDREWYYHFRDGGYDDIVHVDILADDAGHRARIRAALQPIHLPGEETADGFRVYGYAEPGQAVDYL